MDDNAAGPGPGLEHRILIHAPIGKDARLIAHLLQRAGIACSVCAHLGELLEALGQGAGALLVSDEAIKGDFLRAIAGVVRYQPGWSDLPVLVMTRKGAEAPDAQARYLQLGNVSLLERPVQGITLLSAARYALRARRRQYAMRDADRRKDEFLAMLAHELRNPLAPIRAASDLLRIGTPDEGRVRQASEVIGRQVKHMTELVDDLLDLSRVSRGLVALDQALVDARLVIDSAVEQVGPLLESRRHRLAIDTCTEPAFVQGDQKRLVQIVANILHNAVKYTPEGGDIVLALEAGPDSVTFSVADNGVGIAPDVIDHIFDMFAQAQRTPDRAEGGLGIGLALVRNLVTLHGGRVSAASNGAGKGSRFTVVLPRVGAPAGAGAPGLAQAAGQRPPVRRVLVVDDNHDAGDMLGMLLDASGYEVGVVRDANAALARVASDPADVYLLDIGLPDMNGNELARRLRKMPQAAGATLVAITGYGQDEDRQRTAEAGFDAHLTKPVDIDALIAVLARLGEPRAGS